MKVYFVGAGPGDPELLTVKGKRVLEEVQVIIFAGSLVNSELLSEEAFQTKELHDSAVLNLDQIVTLMEEAVKQGKKIARLHSGDPALYGAIQEQIAHLEKRGIPYEVIPGVSSFSAAAAALGREYTVPGISQSLIITRAPGRTGVPENERLSEIARHGCSLCLFLSTGLIQQATEDLLAGGYSPQTPAAVVYKASWPEQKIIRGKLEEISGLVRNEGIEKTALILVGDFLEAEQAGFEASKLYDKDFSHGFRGKNKGEKRD